MFEYNAGSIIKMFASADTTGKSTSEIDTKKEFDMLCRFLNGELEINDEQSDGTSNRVEYTKLKLQDRNLLLDTVEQLKSKFGGWVNKFSPKTEVTSDNINDFYKRFSDFETHLFFCQNDEERQQYFKEIETEYNMLKQKIQGFMKTKGITTEFKQENFGELSTLFNKYETESKIKKFLNNNDSNFKITRHNAEEYSDVIKFLTDNNEASLELSPEDREKAAKIFKQAYAEFLRAYSEDATPENLENIDISFCIRGAIEVHERLDNAKVCGDIVQDAVDKPYDNKKLQKGVKQYIKDNNVPPLKDIPKNVDIGNGKFDKTSTQENNNCWIHAGINSLLSTEKGKQLVESNYYRDEKTGVIAVHIPEAEAFGLHGGIYYITPQEIIDSQETVAHGEGDISAYIIAIKKYFDEVNSNPELKEKIGNERFFMNPDDGNCGFRFYELMTGGTYTEYKGWDNDEIKIQNGIGTSTKFKTDKLYEMIEKQQGAIVISLRNIEHAISIVGVKDGKFLIQESNNTANFFDGATGENNEIIFEPTEPINGRPTFAMTKENLENYDLGAISYIYWN